MQVTYFFNGSMFSLLFYVTLFYIERRWLLMRNLAKILPLKSKSYYVSGAKIFWRRYTKVYRHLHFKLFKNAVLGRQEMVQCKCFFWHQAEICLLKSLFSVIFNDKWVEICKMIDVFWMKLYCKTMSDLFC